MRDTSFFFFLRLLEGRALERQGMCLEREEPCLRLDYLEVGG